MIIHNNAGKPVIGLETIFRILRISGLGLGKFRTNDNTRLKLLITRMLSRSETDEELKDIDRIASIIVSSALDMPKTIIDASGYSLDESVSHAIEDIAELGRSKEQELNDLYQYNLKLNNSWKGWVLRLLGIKLPSERNIDK